MIFNAPLICMIYSKTTKSVNKTYVFYSVNLISLFFPFHMEYFAA
jgi:hypothetical protein